MLRGWNVDVCSQTVFTGSEKIPNQRVDQPKNWRHNAYNWKDKPPGSPDVNFTLADRESTAGTQQSVTTILRIIKNWPSCRHAAHHYSPVEKNRCQQWAFKWLFLYNQPLNNNKNAFKKSSGQKMQKTKDGGWTEMVIPESIFKAKEEKKKSLIWYWRTS